MTNVLAKLDSATVYRTNARKEYGYASSSFASLPIQMCVYIYICIWTIERRISVYIHMYIHTRTFIYKRRVKARENVRWRNSTRYRILIPMHSSVHPSTFSSKYFSHIFLRENVMHTQAHMYLCRSTYTSLHICTYIGTYCTHLHTHFHIHPNPYTDEHAKIPNS